ncbi:TRAP transporter large permease [Cupriavidus sp. IK-TO18]|uniref:TRAP transporter large permease n=1 Tax=Cupriavidus sp. IK-TO18 TaxID=2782182 RepID=UPI00189BE6B3|nr:TRAP transporter large permease [Cupriavidus sp. IK-TO18]MBF6992509.1 TRAP transporter large permease [Cupriavidus sp. IK-TO18]
MTLVEIGYFAMAAMLALILLGVPIGWAMGLVSLAGEIYLTGFTPAAAKLSLTFWENGSLYVFIALPLFLLMGQLAYRTGITEDLFDCFHKWLGHMPGGLAVASVVSNAAYGAVTGNSVASVATMGPMVMPQFRKYGYNLSLATGTLASAGTLAVLVPPSTLMVIYGVWTETSIADLFIAGIVPCVVLTITYCVALAIACQIKPGLGPKGPKYSWGARIRSLSRLAPTVAIIGIVLGGIYGGLMTPSESAAVGVFGVLAIAAAMRRLTWGAISKSLKDAVRTSGMVFVIVVTGVTFSRFLMHTHVTENAIAVINGWGLGSTTLMLALFVLYFLLGAALDALGMMILTLPFVMPLIIHLGVDKVWFGIFLGVMMELAAVSPPVGITVAVMRSVAPDVSTSAIFRGCYPFLALTILLAALLIAWPQLALWMPAQMR